MVGSRSFVTVVGGCEFMGAHELACRPQSRVGQGASIYEAARSVFVAGGGRCLADKVECAATHPADTGGNRCVPSSDARPRLYRGAGRFLCLPLELGPIPVPG